MTLGERIRERRREKKLTQEYLAEQLGVSRQAISKWENDAALPSMENLLELAKLLELPLPQLTGTEQLSTAAQAPLPERHPERIWQLLFFLTLPAALLLAALCFLLLREKPEQAPLSLRPSPTTKPSAAKCWRSAFPT